MRGLGARRWPLVGAIALAAIAAAPAVAQPPGPDDRSDRNLASGDHTADVRAAIEGGRAKNVILFIGDGMGDSEITIARNYARGAAGRLEMDRFPLTGAYTTYAVTKGDPSKPDYVTDSAASGTGWATGTKTYNGAISVDAFGNPVPTVLELAKRNGYRTGNVTTAEVEDATPAVLASHVVNRDCKGPDATSKTCPVNAKENGGAGSIAEQLVQTRPDVLLGGGKAFFDQKVKAGEFSGKTVLEQAAAAGYQTVTEDRIARQGRRHRTGHLPAERRAAGVAAEARRHDPQGVAGPRSRSSGQGFLPPGGRGEHRQAGPRGEPVRSDR